mmetsp:Transcript_36600/g.82313  ORF Transcript_36600/g.82313 Transcript_36600/m.82313 type:complete len:237 (+) Transcript_36600:1538-2248(+)
MYRRLGLICWSYKLGAALCLLRCELGYRRPAGHGMRPALQLVDLGTPVPLTVVDEPVRELFQLQACIFHDLDFLILSRVWMLDVLRTEHPVFQVLHRILSQRSLRLGLVPSWHANPAAALLLRLLLARRRGGPPRRRFGIVLVVVVVAVQLADAGVRQAVPSPWRFAGPAATVSSGRRSGRPVRRAVVGVGLVLRVEWSIVHLLPDRGRDDGRRSGCGLSAAADGEHGGSLDRRHC